MREESRGLETTQLQCPACGETIELLIDCSVSHQEYVEDCEVCCRPMNVAVRIDRNGLPEVRASRAYSA
jgi:Cysteine-rich CPXCG